MHKLFRPGQIDFTQVLIFVIDFTQVLIFVSSHERKSFKDTKRYYITKLQF